MKTKLKKGGKNEEWVEKRIIRLSGPESLPAPESESQAAETTSPSSPQELEERMEDIREQGDLIISELEGVGGAEADKIILELKDIKEALATAPGISEEMNRNYEDAIQRALNIVTPVAPNTDEILTRMSEDEINTLRHTIKELNDRGAYTPYNMVWAIFGDEYGGAKANYEKRQNIWANEMGEAERFRGRGEQNLKINDYLIGVLREHNLLPNQTPEMSEEEARTLVRSAFEEPPVVAQESAEESGEELSIEEKLGSAAKLATETIGTEISPQNIFPTQEGNLEFHASGGLKEGEIMLPEGGRLEGVFNETGQLIRGVEVWVSEGRGGSKGFSRIRKGVFENGNLVEGEMKWSDGLEARGRFNSRGILEEGILISQEGDIFIGKFGERQQLVEGVIEREGGEKEEVGNRPRLAVNDAENILRGLA